MKNIITTNGINETSEDKIFEVTTPVKHSDIEGSSIDQGLKIARQINKSQELPVAETLTNETYSNEINIHESDLIL